MDTNEAHRRLVMLAMDGASRAACEYARQLLQGIDLAPDVTHVEQGRDGSVLLEWVRGDVLLVFEVDEDGKIGYTRAVGPRGKRKFESGDDIGVNRAHGLMIALECREA